LGPCYGYPEELRYFSDRHISPSRSAPALHLQGWEGAPNAKLEIDPAFVQGPDGIKPGQDIRIFTWLHESQRSILKVQPRGDVQKPMMGVFATRSPDRPNPIGLHRATVLSVDGDRWLQVQGPEAIDGTPIIDIKPVLECSYDS
jgi:tRNA-Thr(GGU) m(6)t(6)A37 methyltransferase TsaA